MNKPKLLEQMRSVARLRHLSLRTEVAYADWIRCAPSRSVNFELTRHLEKHAIAARIQRFARRRRCKDTSTNGALRNRIMLSIVIDL